MKKILLSVVAVAASMAAFAQDAETKEPLQGEVSSEVSALRLASELVKYGYAQQSALPLIDALNIIIENPAQGFAEGDGKVVEEGEEVAVVTEGKNGNVTLNVAEIITSAKQFAENDPTLLALLAQVEEASEAPSRGAVGGGKYNVDVVRAGGTDRYTVSFVAGRLAEVALSGDGDTDLDLYVYDSNGNLIASDTDYTDDCYVSWTPRWTGRFTIKVVNRGRVANRYVLVTN